MEGARLNTPTGGTKSWEGVYDRLGDASNVLLLCPPIHHATDETCAALLAPPGCGGVNVLGVELISADRCVSQCTSAEEPTAENISVLTVEERIGGPAPPPTVGEEDVFRSVSSPSDLTGIGIEVQEALEEWHGNGYQTVACIHSLTVLLQYVDLQQAFRFLNVLTSSVELADAIAHYHLDPRAHDVQTVDTLKSLFDGIVEVSADGDVTVTTR